MPDLIDATAGHLGEYGFETVGVRGRPRGPLAREARLQQSEGWGRRPTGLQVIFTLLTQPESLSLTLTEIATRAGVSVATAHRVIADLQHLLDGHGRDRFWVEPRAVVASWLDGYQNVLGGKVPEARYICDSSPQDWFDTRGVMTGKRFSPLMLPSSASARPCVR